MKCAMKFAIRTGEDTPRYEYPGAGCHHSRGTGRKDTAFHPGKRTAHIGRFVMDPDGVADVLSRPRLQVKWPLPDSDIQTYCQFLGQ